MQQLHPCASRWVEPCVAVELWLGQALCLAALPAGWPAEDACCSYASQQLHAHSTRWGCCAEELQDLARLHEGISKAAVLSTCRSHALQISHWRLSTSAIASVAHVEAHGLLLVGCQSCEVRCCTCKTRLRHDVLAR